MAVGLEVTCRPDFPGEMKGRSHAESVHTAKNRASNFDGVILGPSVTKREGLDNPEGGG